MPAKVRIMNKKYTHLFFDLDNTLWDFEKNSKKAMEEAFAYFNLKDRTDFELFFKVYSKHNTQLWESYRNNELSKKELVRKRFGSTFEELKINGIDPEEMNDYYLKVMPKQKELNDGVISVLNYLKNKNYQLFIITNGFREVQQEKLLSSGLSPFFSKIFISEEIRTPKPGREIFEHAVKSANARKNKSLMIGDDLEVDVEGALNFGMDAVYYQNNPKLDFRNLSSKNGIKRKIYEIGTLQQLKNLL